MLAQVINTQTTTINPLGYTYVRLDGSVDPAISRNVTSVNVVRNDSRVYGFRNLPFIPRNIQIALAFRTQAVTNNGRGWEARRDMNATTDSNWWKTYRDEGYRLVNVEVYQTTQGRRYADVGRQNGDSLNWAAKFAQHSMPRTMLKPNRSLQMLNTIASASCGLNRELIKLHRMTSFSTGETQQRSLSL